MDGQNFFFASNLASQMNKNVFTSLCYRNIDYPTVNVALRSEQKRPKLWTTSLKYSKPPLTLGSSRGCPCCLSLDGTHMGFGLGYPALWLCLTL